MGGTPNHHTEGGGRGPVCFLNPFWVRRRAAASCPWGTAKARRIGLFFGAPSPFPYLGKGRRVLKYFVRTSPGAGSQVEALEYLWGTRTRRCWCLGLRRPRVLEYS